MHMIKFLSFFSKSYILTLPFLIIFAGYSRNIPGKGGRYKVIGTNESGIWDLEIKNVSLQDDADYECQVGPANYNRPIRHRAHLHVLCKHTRSIFGSTENYQFRKTPKRTKKENSQAAKKK